MARAEKISVYKALPGHAYKRQTNDIIVVIPDGWTSKIRRKCIIYYSF